MKAKKGKLIVFEGIDGAGKTTQAFFLFNYLKRLGKDVVTTKWNSSDIVAPAIKQGKRQKVLSPLTFSLLHAADFYDRYNRIIRPALEAGKIVICDRYRYTGLVRDGVRGVDPDLLKTLYGFDSVLSPDLCIYQRVKVDLAIRRIRAKGGFNHYSSGQDFLKGTEDRTARRYLRLMLSKYNDVWSFAPIRHPSRFMVLDGSKPITKISEVIREAVNELLEGR